MFNIMYLPELMAEQREKGMVIFQKLLRAKTLQKQKVTQSDDGQGSTWTRLKKEPTQFNFQEMAKMIGAEN